MKNYMVELQLFPRTNDEEVPKYILIKLPSNKLNQIIITLFENFNIEIR
jgi:hypothetical protein